MVPARIEVDNIYTNVKERTNLIHLKHPSIQEIQQLFKFQRQQCSFILKKQNKTESEHSLNAASQTVVKYSKDYTSGEPFTSFNTGVKC